MSKFDVLGVSRANKDAHEKNALRLPECPCTSKDTCQDVLEVPAVDGDSLVSVTIDGQVISFKEYTCATYTCQEEVLPIFDGGEITSEVVKFLTWAAKKFEYNILVKAELNEAGDALVVTHVGQHVFEAITTDAGEGLGVRCCEIVALTAYAASVIGDPVPAFSFGGASASLATASVVYVSGDAVANDATAATLAADVEAVLATLGYAYASVVVSVNDDEGVFKVEIKSEEKLPVVIGDKPFLNCGTDQEFSC